MKKSLLIKTILSIPKTLWFNFKCFPVKEALTFPVLISSDTKIGSLNGDYAVKSEHAL